LEKRILKSNTAHANRSMGPHVRQVIPSAIDNVDPFVFLDHFGPIEKNPGGLGVPPHPHAGIATITYLFSGSNRHQDSYGHDVVIQAGDLAWMRAGKGIVHAEGMNEAIKEPETVHGLQLWISLPAKDKFIEPDFFYYPSIDLPTIEKNDVSIKVLCGELFGKKSPVSSLSPAYIFEIKMPAGSTIEIPIKMGDTAGLYMIAGHVQIDGKILVPPSMTSFDDVGDVINLQAKDDNHIILLGGTPLKEPIVAYGSYVMNSNEQIRQVINDYQAGKMGTVTS
jgi:quercetin 2,3-dioxygenase